MGWLYLHITSSLTPLHGWDVRAGYSYPALPQNHSLALSWTGHVFSCTEPITSFNPQLSKAGRGPWMPVLALDQQPFSSPGQGDRSPAQGSPRHLHVLIASSARAQQQREETQSAPEPCLTSVSKAAHRNVQPLHFAER